MKRTGNDAHSGCMECVVMRICKLMHAANRTSAGCKIRRHMTSYDNIFY